MPVRGRTRRAARCLADAQCVPPGKRKLRGTRVGARSLALHRRRTERGRLTSCIRAERMGSSAPSVVIATRTAGGTDRPSSVVVRTPLELIRVLDDHDTIATAVLADDFAGEGVEDFLRETYPRLRLLTMDD